LRYIAVRAFRSSVRSKLTSSALDPRLTEKVIRVGNAPPGPFSLIVKESVEALPTTFTVVVLVVLASTRTSSVELVSEHECPSTRMRPSLPTVSSAGVPSIVTVAMPWEYTQVA
jgi:hypothetical protein